MTVAEQIKRNTSPFGSYRWLSASAQRVSEKVTIYRSSEENVFRSHRITVWEYKFIDGSELTHRHYHQ